MERVGGGPGAGAARVFSRHRQSTGRQRRGHRDGLHLDRRSRVGGRRAGTPAFLRRARQRHLQLGWQANHGFLAPSGYQGFPIPASLREAGSNGLALGRGGLLIADSGTRALARVDLATRQKTVFAGSYQGKRFNSPNDLVVARNGDIYFTDPPYGLAGGQKSPLRELTYTGVFRVTPDNQVHLIADNCPRTALRCRRTTAFSTPRTIQVGWPSISMRPACRPDSGSSLPAKGSAARAGTA